MIEKYIYRKVPDYYPDMYWDGFTPEEIHYAHNKAMMNQIQERENEKNIQKEIGKVAE